METNKTYAVVVSKRATQMLVSHAAFPAKVSRGSGRSTDDFL